MTENNWLKDEPERENLQSRAIGVVTHPALDDLGRFLSHDPLSHRSLAPAAMGRHSLRKCKISIISGFPQAT